MRLRIVNAGAATFHDGVGINSERATELARQVDNLFLGYSHSIKPLVLVFRDIAAFCTSEEELVFCTILYCGKQARRGNIVSPEDEWLPPNGSF